MLGYLKEFLISLCVFLRLFLSNSLSRMKCSHLKVYHGLHRLLATILSLIWCYCLNTALSTDSSIDNASGRRICLTMDSYPARPPRSPPVTPLTYGTLFVSAGWYQCKFGRRLQVTRVSNFRNWDGDIWRLFGSGKQERGREGNL